MTHRYDRVITADEAQRLFEEAGMVEVEAVSGNDYRDYLGYDGPFPRCYVTGINPLTGMKIRADGGWQAVNTKAQQAKAEIASGRWSVETMRECAKWISATKWYSGWVNEADGTIEVREYMAMRSSPVLKVARTVEEVRAITKEAWAAAEADRQWRREVAKAEELRRQKKAAAEAEKRRLRGYTY